LLSKSEEAVNMVDGWYCITFGNGNRKVVYCVQNNTEIGSVRHLLGQGCLFEEACILTPKELEALVEKLIKAQAA
jgi:hypothetical protein